MNNKTVWLRKIIPFSIGIGILFFLIAKSILMQITCDEAYTVMILTKESVWNVVSYKSSYTNNHILNTLLVKFLFSLFQSTSHALARVPNIAAFILYFYALYQFSRRFITHDWVSLLFVILLCCNPYLLDFFALTRGYGLSVGLMMMSVYSAARFIFTANRQSLPLSICCAVLAVYAQFATLHFYLGINLYIIIFLFYKLLILKEKKIFYFGIVTQLVGAILLTLLIYLPITAILRDNQIAYYGKDGFWENSILSQIKGGIYGITYFSVNTFSVFKSLTILALFSIVGRLSYLWGAKKISIEEAKYPLFFIVGLFACIGLSIILQFHVLGNQYVIDRAAIFLYPFIAMLLVAVPMFWGELKTWVFHLTLTLLLIFPVYHILRANKLTSYYEWWYDTHTYEVINILKNEYDKKDPKQPIRFHTTWMVNPSFAYHRGQDSLTWIAPIPFNSNPDTINIYDFYYAEQRDLQILEPFYEKVKVWDNGEWTLLKRKASEK